MSDLAALKKRADEARAAATLAQRVYEQALCDVHPWQPGTVLRSKGGKEAIVLSLRRRPGANDVETIAALRRKDGTFGNAVGLNRAKMYAPEWIGAEIIA